MTIKKYVDMANKLENWAKINLPNYELYNFKVLSCGNLEFYIEKENYKNVVRENKVITCIQITPYQSEWSTCITTTINDFEKYLKKVEGVTE